MKPIRISLLFAIFVLFTAATTLQAHHSFAAEFDADKPVTVTGVITQVRMENPHSWFFLEVKGANGKVEKWGFEANTPSSLLRSGVKPSFVKNGDTVTINGWHARDMTQNMGCARELVLADGRAFAIGPVVGAGGR